MRLLKVRADGNVCTGKPSRYKTAPDHISQYWRYHHHWWFRYRSRVPCPIDWYLRIGVKSWPRVCGQNWNLRTSPKNCKNDARACPQFKYANHRWGGRNAGSVVGVKRHGVHFISRLPLWKARPYWAMAEPSFPSRAYVSARKYTVITRKNNGWLDFFIWTGFTGKTR